MKPGGKPHNFLVGQRTIMQFEMSSTSSSSVEPFETRQITRVYHIPKKIYGSYSNCSQKSYI